MCNVGKLGQLSDHCLEKSPPAPPAGVVLSGDCCQNNFDSLEGRTVLTQILALRGVTWSMDFNWDIACLHSIQFAILNSSGTLIDLRNTQYFVNENEEQIMVVRNRVPSK